MKKVFFSLAVLCSVALVSCGGNKAEKADSDSVAGDSIEVAAVAVSESDSNGQAVEVAEVATETPAADSAAK